MGRRPGHSRRRRAHLCIGQGERLGLDFAGIDASFAAAIVCLGIFVIHCRRARNPLVEPGLFHSRSFVGASLVTLPFAIAFGAMLLSIVLWQQGTWGWSALKTGLGIAPGPLLVPTVSLLIAGRLIKRFGAAPVVTAGLLSFAVGVAWWALAATLEPDYTSIVFGMMLSGIGVGLTLPTLMGTATGSLPASSFATGSGVINMIRQTGLAVGVAALVAIVGAPGSQADRLIAFQHAWWAMAATVLLGLIPTALLLVSRRRLAAAPAST